MFNNIALDVFIGLVFVYLLYSLLATIIHEMIATQLGFRAKILEKAILRMLEDGRTTTKFRYGDRINGLLHLFGLKSLLKGKAIAPWFYAHPLMKYLSEDNFYSKPAYITAQNFSKVVIDLLRGFGRPESEAVQSIHDSITNGVINKLPINISTASTDRANPAIKILIDEQTNNSSTVNINPNTKLFLQSLWQEAGADPTVFKAKLEDWFNDTMERATGWYKRYTKIVLFIIGMGVAYVFNVDTIAIHRILSTNKTAREQMVQIAIKNKDNLDPSKVLTDKIMQSDSLLKATYKMVANDALQANDVLGLGRSWKDTCKICGDSLGNTDFETRFNFLGKENDNANDSIAVLISKIGNSIKTQDSIKDEGDTGKKIIQISRIIKNDSTYLVQLQTNKNPDYQRMLLLKERCEYISKKREGKWNLYSPNQSGGWETFFGWLITALALTLGAPFWFDLLSKLIKIRGTATNNDNTPTTSTPSGGSSNSNAPNSSAPVNINVNSNPGDEAVG